MLKMLEFIVNEDQKSDLESMFGRGSSVIFESLKYSTNKKKFVVAATLYVDPENINPDTLNELFPHGLELLIQESWKYSGLDEKFIIITSLKIK